MRKAMKFLNLILLLVSPLMSAQLLAQAQVPLALVGGTLIDGTGALPVKDAAVVMQGDKITALGARNQVTIPSSAAVIEVTGKFILPGLIDSHVHLGMIGVRGKHGEAYGKDLLEVIAKNARAHLLSGVTTVFDVGGPYHELKQIRDEINSGERAGARIFMAGPIILNDRGYPIPAPRSPAEALHLKRLVRGEFNGVEGARQKVSELVKLGVDHIKVYQTGDNEWIAQCIIDV